MKVIEKVLAITAAIGAFFSAVFYVLFRLSKDERELLQAEYETTKTEKETVEKVNEIITATRQETVEELKKDEEKISNAKNGNRLDNFNALNDLLSK